MIPMIEERLPRHQVSLREAMDRVAAKIEMFLREGQELDIRVRENGGTRIITVWPVRAG